MVKTKKRYFAYLMAFDRKSKAKAKFSCSLAAGAMLVAMSLNGVSAGEPQSASSVSAKSATTLYQFPGFPRVVISDHGNLLRFEGPTGYDHIGVGSFSEGYVLCYGSSSAYDTGSAESGFGPATASCSGSSCTVTRNTIDGILQLKQVITANNADRSASIAMTVRNLTGSNVANVVLRRQADLDVDTGGSLGTNDFNNWFGSSERDSVFAWNPADASATAEGHAVVLSARKPRQAFAKVTAAILDSTCNPTNIAAAGPVQGDYGVTLQHNLGNLGGGSSRSVTVKYTRN